MPRFWNKLQTRIFLFFVILLVIIQGFSFWMSFQTHKQLEQQQISSRIANAVEVFRNQFDARSFYLGVFSEVVSQDYSLKEIFIEGDMGSFLTALGNHQRRIKANLSMSVDKDGKIIAQLISGKNDKGQTRYRLGPEQGKVFSVSFNKAQSTVNLLYQVGGSLYQMQFSRITAGGNTLLGWVGFGFKIDAELATELMHQTGLTTGFALVDPQFKVSEVRQSTATDGDMLKDLAYQLVGKFSDHRYLFWSQKLGAIDNKALYTYMYLPREQVLAPLKEQWWQQLWIVISMLPLSMLAAYYISRSITKPIKHLIEQAKFIAGGNYDHKVKESSTIELAQLAHEFSEMQQAILSREQRIVYQAFHDPLTNLPNRNELDRMLSTWMEQDEQFMICLVNVKRMTEVNATLGHGVGDEIIKEVGRRLESMKNVNFACRISGDEFALVLNDFHVDDIGQLIASLREKMARRYRYQGLSLELDLTMGVAIRNHSSSMFSVLQQANTALQYAKSNKLEYQIYDKQIDQHTVERLQLINGLKSAIESDQLVLYYQPKLCLKKNAVIKVEALVRWAHPEKGMIPPDVFIPIAEKTGQMNALTRWVLETAIKQYKQWRAKGIELGIAINISAENLKDSSFCQWVLNTISQHQVPISAFTLEITEDAVVSDLDSAIMQLSYWRAKGLKLSIDDFGTGYSSLGQLKQLPVDEVKIDRSFVQQLMSNTDDQIIVKSTIELAHNLNLFVVAEGVENQDTLDWLRERGCEMAQGYHLSKPISGSDLETWLLQSEYFYHSTPQVQI
ncbi:sensor domain-containing phosphodiesterase [Parashewanella curva]|uniref:cyclic-guanylate-specific phosphodiesterase n=1 Tax=Parashewanella curva TaxID=2338552 RepID=A0A3L8PY42_9GAMM|nr:bifunctional diguanylate cyclase/phosphodiesterase [Parashewanella curva]RLV59378.1 sensor domain-containing phosphodiesterase [Parashewanella curva]